jgi:GT2 family glycosyltransferase
MPDLSVVIVSYKTRALLEQCLRSSLSTGDRRLMTEVIVIDNASPDDSAQMVRAQFPNVHLIANAENRGFAAANNQGIRATHGRYALALNPDTIVKPGALETLVAFMDSYPRVGACGARLLYADGSFQHSAFRFPDLFQIYFDFFPTHWRLTESRLNGRYPRAWYQRGEPFAIDHPLGATLMMRREVIDRVGMFDEGFFIYAEEIDWCMRIKRAGWEIYCVPRAEIYHLEAQSTRQFRDAMFVALWRARLRLFAKHYSPAFCRAARWIVCVGLWNEARKVRAAARAGQVTQDEMAWRLDAYAQVWHNIVSRVDADHLTS